MAWKKGGRNGVVVRGAGGPGTGGQNPGGGTVRIAGRVVPWGAEVEYAYRAGYDSRGRVSVTHLVDGRGLARDGAAGAWMIPGSLLLPPTEPDVRLSPHPALHQMNKTHVGREHRLFRHRRRVHTSLLRRNSLRSTLT